SRLRPAREHLPVEEYVGRAPVAARVLVHAPVGRPPPRRPRQIAAAGADRIQRRPRGGTHSQLPAVNRQSAVRSHESEARPLQSTPPGPAIPPLSMLRSLSASRTRTATSG